MCIQFTCTSEMRSMSLNITAQIFPYMHAQFLGGEHADGLVVCGSGTGNWLSILRVQVGGSSSCRMKTCG